MENKEKIESFTDLEAWQKSHQFVLDIYKIANNFPKEEKFGLVNQLKRAVVSINSNIAEGFSRKSKKDKNHFYTISLGSLAEVQNQLLVANDLGYLEKDKFNDFAKETVIIRKLLNGLIGSAQSK